MAANPLLSALGAAITAPGDYTRGLLQGELGRVSPEQFLQNRGVQDPGFLQSMGLDFITDPSFLAPVAKGLLTATAAGALGMAISKSTGKNVAKELTQEQIELAAKNAAKKARRKARSQAEREATEQVIKERTTVPEHPLLVERMPVESQKQLRKYRLIEDEAKNIRELNAERAKRGLVLDQDLQRLEIAESRMDDMRALGSSGPMLDPALRSEFMQRKHSLAENPLFYSRLNRVLKIADPQATFQNPEDILKTLREVQGPEGFDESELQLLLTRLTTPKHPRNVDADFAQMLDGIASPASAKYLPVPERGPVDKILSDLWSANNWKQARIDQLQWTPRTIGELSQFAEKNPALAMQEYNVSNKLPSGFSPPGIDDPDDVRHFYPLTQYEEYNVPYHRDNYSERILYPATKATAPATYPTGQPSLLERWSLGGAGNPASTDHFTDHNFAPTLRPPAENRYDEITPQSLLFMLTRLREKQGGGKLLSAEQMQSDIVNRIFKETEEEASGADVWLKDHPIAEMLKSRMPDIAMARLIRDAAEQGAEGVTWHPGSDVRMFTGGKLSGQQQFYGRNWPDPSGVKEGHASRMMAAAEKYANMIPGARVDRVDLTPFDAKMGWHNQDSLGNASLETAYKGESYAHRAFQDAKSDYLKGVDSRLEDMVRTMEPDAAKSDEAIRVLRERRSVKLDSERKLNEVHQWYKGLLDERLEATQRGQAPKSVDAQVAEKERRLREIKDTYLKRERELEQKLDSMLMEPRDDGRSVERLYLKSDYAQRLFKDIGTQDTVKDEVLNFAPRWGLHLTPESLEWIKKHFKVPLLSAAGMAGGGSLLNALRGAGGGQPAA